MSSMQHRIDEQHEEICNLTHNNQRLNHENTKLKEENKDLKERLSKYETPVPPQTAKTAVLRQVKNP